MKAKLWQVELYPNRRKSKRSPRGGGCLKYVVAAHDRETAIQLARNYAKRKMAIMEHPELNACYELFDPVLCIGEA